MARSSTIGALLLIVCKIEKQGPMFDGEVLDAGLPPLADRGIPR